MTRIYIYKKKLNKIDAKRILYSLSFLCFTSYRHKKWWKEYIFGPIYVENWKKKKMRYRRKGHLSIKLNSFPFVIYREHTFEE